MKTENMVIIGLIAILFGLIIFGSAKSKTGNVIADASKEDVFNGVITNMELEPMILEGVGVYDKSCNMIENGLTQCDAGIQTEKGLLNFNYRHNMGIQPCIAPNDKLKVEILEGGKAIVTR